MMPPEDPFGGDGTNRSGPMTRTASPVRPANRSQGEKSHVCDFDPEKGEQGSFRVTATPTIEPQDLDVENIMPGARPLLLKPLQRVTLKFEDVVYKVKLNAQLGSWWRSFSKRNERRPLEKTILHGVTGMVCPGEILAMLGPSGSGKTTLLSALGGRLEGKVSGSILYNGQRYGKSMKRKTGFVTQDDILYPHLTVRETLLYAALLRLPRAMSSQDKITHVDGIISELGLNRCRNTIIGGPLFRGVSGGERKRVSIGHEMLTNPSVLLLDEPTSGLDSTIAQRIIVTLQNLARGGRTVITTIHQPSSRVYHMFHKVILLSEGNVIYYGEASIAMEYFYSVGFSPAFPMNPADFMLDLANGIAPDAIRNEDGGMEQGESQVRKEMDDQKNFKQILVAHYKKNLAPKIKAELNNEDSCSNGEKPRSNGEKNEWATSWWEQFSVLLRRSLKERRHESFGGLRVFQVLSVAVVAGLLWWQCKTSQIQDQVGLLFFFSIFWGFFPLFSAIFTFPQENAMLIKERSSGMYRLSSYFMARTVGDLPMELILPTIFVFIAYWMGGLNPDVRSFTITLLIILFNVLVSQGMGLAMGAALMDVKQATTLSSVTMLTFLLVGGYYIHRIPAFIAWLKYVSFSYYCYRLLIGVQYTRDEMYDCGNKKCPVANYPAIKAVGLSNHELDVAAMAVMLVGYRLLAYLALRRLKTRGSH